LGPSVTAHGFLLPPLGRHWYHAGLVAVGILSPPAYIFEFMKIPSFDFSTWIIYVYLGIQKDPNTIKF
jgi:hypothetical protein